MERWLLEAFARARGLMSYARPRAQQRTLVDRLSERFRFSLPLEFGAALREQFDCRRPVQFRTAWRDSRKQRSIETRPRLNEETRRRWRWNACVAYGAARVGVVTARHG